jgi:hypothetical protein
MQSRSLAAGVDDVSIDSSRDRDSYVKRLLRNKMRYDVTLSFTCIQLALQACMHAA